MQAYPLPPTRSSTFLLRTPVLVVLARSRGRIPPQPYHTKSSTASRVAPRALSLIVRLGLAGNTACCERWSLCLTSNLASSYHRRHRLPSSAGHWLILNAFSPYEGRLACNRPTNQRRSLSPWSLGSVWLAGAGRPVARNSATSGNQSSPFEVTALTSSFFFFFLPLSRVQRHLLL